MCCCSTEAPTTAPSLPRSAGAEAVEAVRGGPGGRRGEGAGGGAGAQAGKVYVQQRVREAGARVWELLQGGAHFYVCGDAGGMAPAVQAALLDVIAAHQVRPAAAPTSPPRPLPPQCEQALCNRPPQSLKNERANLVSNYLHNSSVCFWRKHFLASRWHLARRIIRKDRR